MEAPKRPTPSLAGRVAIVVGALVARGKELAMDEQQPSCLPNQALALSVLISRKQMQSEQSR